MAWVGLPPTCGQAGFRCGGGRVTVSDWMRGSAVGPSSSSSTGMRLPGKGGGALEPNHEFRRSPPGPTPPGRAGAIDGSSWFRRAGRVAADRLEQLLGQTLGRGGAVASCSTSSSAFRACFVSPARRAAAASSIRAGWRQGVPFAARGPSRRISSSGSAVSISCDTPRRLARLRNRGSTLGSSATGQVSSPPFRSPPWILAGPARGAPSCRSRARRRPRLAQCLGGLGIALVGEGLHRSGEGQGLRLTRMLLPALPAEKAVHPRTMTKASPTTHAP